jgi:hypothetical protein
LEFSAKDSIDPRFTPSVQDGAVKTLAVQADGSVWIGGSFTSIGGVTRNQIALIA